LTRSRSQPSEEEYETVATLIYAMNGVTRRITGEPGFNGE